MTARAPQQIPLRARHPLLDETLRDLIVGDARISGNNADGWWALLRGRSAWTALPAADRAEAERLAASWSRALVTP